MLCFDTIADCSSFPNWDLQETVCGYDLYGCSEYLLLRHWDARDVLFSPEQVLFDFKRKDAVGCPTGGGLTWLV